MLRAPPHHLRAHIAAPSRTAAAAPSRCAAFLSYRQVIGIAYRMTNVISESENHENIEDPGTSIVVTAVGGIKRRAAAQQRALASRMASRVRQQKLMRASVAKRRNNGAALRGNSAPRRGAHRT
jgi:hypothetical protein